MSSKFTDGYRVDELEQQLEAARSEVEQLQQKCDQTEGLLSLVGDALAKKGDENEELRAQIQALEMQKELALQTAASHAETFHSERQRAEQAEAQLAEAMGLLEEYRDALLQLASNDGSEVDVVWFARAALGQYEEYRYVEHVWPEWFREEAEEAALRKGEGAGG